MADTHSSVRVIVFTVLIIGIGASVYYFARAPKPVQPVSSVRVPVPAEEPTAPEEPIPTAPNPLPQPVAVESTPVIPRELQTNGLTGTWELSVLEEDSGEMENYFRFDLDDRSGELQVASVEVYPNLAVSLDGNKLVLSSHRDNFHQTFEGILNTGKTEARGRYITRFVFEDTEQPEHTDASEAMLTLLSPSFLEQERDAENILVARQEEARAIYDAIHAFASENDGKFPSALSQIPISSFPDPASIAHVPGRTITYSGGGAVLDKERLSEVQKQLAVDKLSTEFLVEHERQLREVWGGETPSASPLLRIQYASPPLTIDIATTGVVSMNEFPPTDAAAGNDPAELRSLEYNNLKQLAIVVKMFQSENNDFIPPGWLTIYPEYLTNTDVLRSPWSENRNPSYQLLYPGAHQNDLYAIAQELFDAGLIELENVVSDPEPIGPHLEGHIPVIVGTDLLPMVGDSPPMRAVAFLDGHVEAVPVDDWERRITPFQR
ncbi:MAG: hypothetical protein SGI88_01855 [Candidatus Hydrogenedentes bacterium]|nr:hypothetical protein [Candidatus Hydrogenedentota bacterium]